MEKLNFGDEPNSHIIGKVNFGGRGKPFEPGVGIIKLFWPTKLSKVLQTGMFAPNFKKICQKLPMKMC